METSTRIFLLCIKQSDRCFLKFVLTFMLCFRSQFLWKVVCASYILETWGTHASVPVTSPACERFSNFRFSKILMSNAVFCPLASITPWLKHEDFLLCVKQSDRCFLKFLHRGSSVHFLLPWFRQLMFRFPSPPLRVRGFTITWIPFLLFRTQFSVHDLPNSHLSFLCE